MARSRLERKGLSLAGKLIFSLCTIASVLLATAVMSILEYRRMSDYVTEEIGMNIGCINASRSLSELVDGYGHDILLAVGSADSLSAGTANEVLLREKDCREAFSALLSLETEESMDSLKASFESYIRTAEELPSVLESGRKAAMDWFFGTLRPCYSEFNRLVVAYDSLVHERLMIKADEFDLGFYRSLVPVIVSVIAGLLLITLLLFFLLSFYVKPLYRMLGNMEDYISHGKKYTYDFEGDDQLRQLNAQITEVVDENVEFKRRVKQLKEEKLREES